MQQVSWRADVDLVLRVKRAAAHQGCSMNEFMSLVLDVATNPDHAVNASASLRERLHLAGLLAEVATQVEPPPLPDEVREAGRRLAGGVPLSDLVIEERR